VDGKRNYEKRKSVLRSFRNTVFTTDPGVLGISNGKFSRRFIKDQRKGTARNRALMNYRRPSGQRTVLLLQLREKQAVRFLILDIEKYGLSSSVLGIFYSCDFRS